MRIALLQVDLIIPEARSLKDKRRELKSIKQRIRNALNVSVAEVDYHNKWQRAALAIVMVAHKDGAVEKEMDQALRIIELNGQVTILAHSLEML